MSAFKSPCDTKEDLRYQLAAAVVLNAWIESERLEYPQRKRFYAFKQEVDRLGRLALAAQGMGIAVWREDSQVPNEPLLLIRVDNVDFSFHVIPLAQQSLATSDLVGLA